MENNYITNYLEKITEVSRTASPEELLTLIKNLEDLLNKKIEADKNLADPNRLQEFGTSEEKDNIGFGSI